MSVLMSCYNAEKYVVDAMNSMLNQTYTNIELVIINDGSTDSTLDKLSAFTDPRIKLISRENKGLVYSLNEGLSLCNGKYIARMDADDISTPDRIKKQVALLEDQPNISVCGGAVEEFDENGVIKVTRKPLQHVDLLFYSLRRSPLAHPAATIRKSVLIDNNLQYDPVYKFGQDVKLWSEIIQVGQLANIDDIVLYYRRSADQVTKAKRKEQKALANKARYDTYLFIKNNLHRLGKVSKNNQFLYFRYQIEHDKSIGKRKKLLLILTSSVYVHKKIALFMYALFQKTK